MTPMTPPAPVERMESPTAASLYQPSAVEMVFTASLSEAAPIIPPSMGLTLNCLAACTPVKMARYARKAFPTRTKSPMTTAEAVEVGITPEAIIILMILPTPLQMPDAMKAGIIGVKMSASTLTASTRRVRFWAAFTLALFSRQSSVATPSAARSLMPMSTRIAITSLTLPGPSTTWT